LEELRTQSFHQGSRVRKQEDLSHDAKI
jgi:hypothetical protein